MNLEDLAKRLCDREHIGLNDELAGKLGLTSADATRGRLMALSEVNRPYFGVYLLAAYVIDDTDFWGDGEIYWWSIPVMVDADGTATKNPLYGLPNGMAPHKVGSHEWMTNLSLNQMPLIAVIPPEERVTACTIRLGFYDDDGKPADMRAAITAGIESFAALPNEPQPSAEQLVAPVRQAIFNALKAQQDDILLDQELTIRQGSAVLFSSGIVGSIMNSNIRVYYFVKNEQTTQQFGPVALHKGQTETVCFSTPMKGGGRLALFARGADVSCSAFGEISDSLPFLNRIIDTNHEGGLANGFNITGNGPAKFIAFYTPPG